MTKYKKWMSPLPGFSNFYLFELKEDFDGLKILIKEVGMENKQMNIYFSNYLGYRVVDESAFLKTLNEGDLWQFSQTDDSEFLNWFKRESFNVFRDYNLVHYVILSSNKVIEIIGGNPPSVSI